MEHLQAADPVRQQTSLAQWADPSVSQPASSSSAAPAPQYMERQAGELVQPTFRRQTTLAPVDNEGNLLPYGSDEPANFAGPRVRAPRMPQPPAGATPQVTTLRDALARAGAVAASAVRGRRGSGASNPRSAFQPFDPQAPPDP